jgi:hypothetical protein
MNVTHVANTSRLVALAAAFLVTAIEWTAFSEILLLIDPAHLTGVQAANASPDGALAEVVVSAHRTPVPRS